MPPPMTRDDEMEHVHLYVNEFKDRCRERIVNDFPSLRARLSRIGSLISAIDLQHLSNVPIQIIAEFRKIVQRATKCITDYMMQSYPADLRVINGQVPP